MIDPARTEVKEAINTARDAGIRTIMITGDYPNTARAIAEEIGLLQAGHKVMTGAEMNKLTDEEMLINVRDTDVYARVSPEHKMRIVDALRTNKEVVAMTGTASTTPRRSACRYWCGNGHHRDGCGERHSRYGPDR